MPLIRYFLRIFLSEAGGISYQRQVPFYSCLSLPLLPSPTIDPTTLPSDGTNSLPVLADDEYEKVNEVRAKEILSSEDFKVLVDLYRRTVIFVRNLDLTRNLFTIIIRYRAWLWNEHSKDRPRTRYIIASTQPQARGINHLETLRELTK